MASIQEDYVTGSDLDDLFSLLEGGFLDDDFDFEKDLEAAVHKTPPQLTFSCDFCQKSYKTERGLNRHKRLKHGQEIETGAGVNSSAKLEQHKLCEILNSCIEKTLSDCCLPEATRNKFKGITFCLDDANELLKIISHIVENFSGDAEVFYADFYGLLLENCLPNKFTDITLSNILLTEVANHILIYLTSADDKNILGNEDGNSTEKIAFSLKEINVIQYMAGYVIHKLYKKIKFSENNQGSQQFNDQMLSVLLACKVDIDESQIYCNMRDRGGLWKTTKDTQNIFVQAEKIFRSKTSTFVTNICSNSLVTNMLSDASILSSFRNICYNIPNLNEEIKMNLLESMLMLFTRVRTFSYAKDIREKFKIRKKQSKKSSLRTEIKKSSSSKDLGH